MNLYKYQFIKVPFHSSKIYPLEKNVAYICNKLKKSGIYDYIGESALDGSPIFKFKDGIIRSVKLNKILNNIELISKIENFIRSVEKSIKIIQILDED
ncbi:MAG: hypothetical protein ACOC3Z_03380 [Nanoarchaeota archaeon]